MSAPAPVIAQAKRSLLAAGGIIGAAVLGTIICKINAGYWVPPAAFLQALVYGALNAMFAIGIVLIYRAGRIVNFSQGSLGITGAMLFLMLMAVEGWSFWLAFPAAIGVSLVIGMVVELFVVRRLAKAPRLALTVVTIGVGQALVSVTGFMPTFFLDPGEEIPLQALDIPFSSFEFTWAPIVFTGNHMAVIAVALVVMGGLAAFFRFTSVGIAVRGAAENDDRASLLGINVNNLSTLVWVLAAGLSGLAALLNIMIQPGVLGLSIATTTASVLLRALTAAVIGRMDNLPMTVAGAMGIAVFEQAMFWAFDTTALVDLALLVVVVVVLLAQRGTLARTDEGGATWAANVEIRAIPHELRDLPVVRSARRRVLYVVVAATAAFPWVMSPAQTSLGTIAVIYCIVVVSLVVLTGWGGQISLGQFAFVATGGVVGGALTSKVGVPFGIALVLGSLAGAAVAVAVGLPAMRIRGLFLAVTTLAFSVAVATVFLNPRFFGWLLPDTISRPKLLFLDSEDERVYFYLCVAGLLFAIWVAHGLRNSRAGRVLIAMRENERTAQAFAINRLQTRLVTFAISGFLAAFAGVLLAHQQHSVRETAFAPAQSLNIFVIAVVGGLGSVPGSLLGVLYVVGVDIFVNNEFIRQLAIGIAVIAILLYYPGGLGGLAFKGRDAWLRRVAMRNRIYVPSLVGDHRVLDGEHTKAVLAPKFGEAGRDVDVPVKYRIPSVIGVRGESQQGRAWRYE